MPIGEADLEDLFLGQMVHPAASAEMLAAALQRYDLVLSVLVVPSVRLRQTMMMVVGIDEWRTADDLIQSLIFEQLTKPDMPLSRLSLHRSWQRFPLRMVGEIVPILDHVRPLSFHIYCHRSQPYYIGSMRCILESRRHDGGHNGHTKVGLVEVSRTGRKLATTCLYRIC